MGETRHEIAERNLAAKIAAARLLVGFHLADAFPDAVTLGLGEGGGDREEQFRETVA
jgi:hypothetical protein